ncbi:ScbR family autoregulator-binding transcription factor [Cryobacterium sp. PH31-O1]|uniref:ScbR family autoregulator-binding transcription factor n=1 Tax=Cryobacterium sp. PH31-O1 TaxID=3046306 RepID=UPI0024BAC8A0|nr:ScbR family autoregulator-binding transcription factor [Cryobacterium sp. PH31-O1]MDJ0339462.1 ScbR family autoregulator-binding transcription factor [Cryobacterium sp. PH31-O1]
MQQQARAIETRAAIIRGAAAAFEQRGYGSTSLAQVSAAAGVTKGALYFHFDSKEALAVAIIDAQHEQSAGAGQLLLEKDVPGLRALISMSYELARQLRDDLIVSAGVRLTIEAANFSTPVSAPYLDWMVTCEEFLRRAITAGDVAPTLDVPAAAAFFTAAFTGVQLVSDVLNGRSDIDQRLTEMWALLLPGLVVSERWDELKNLAADVQRERAAAAALD